MTTAIRMLRDEEMRSLSETFSVEFGNKLIFRWIPELGEYKLVFVGCQTEAGTRDKDNRFPLTSIDLLR